jgi:peroxiredoxin
MKKLFAIALLLSCQIGIAAPIEGLWSGKLKVGAADVPFRIQFSGSGSGFKAWFFNNGDERVLSTSGTSTATTIDVSFAGYNSRLTAKLSNGGLDGEYARDGKVYPVHAVPYQKPAPPAGKVPDIAGAWFVENGAEKGEKAWHLLVKQSGADVTAAILRVDGDTGELTGRYEDGHFTISHFSGARPVVFTLTPATDGSLSVVQNNRRKMTAVRLEVAKAKGLPGPEDPTQHITMRDPKEPLRFSFPDLAGHMVSNTDPRFKGKVVIVSLGGSWCPNCHDEAPLMVDLYRKYKSQGLEIVDLSFEEDEQMKNPARLREFIKEYGITYPVLLVGDPSTEAAKLPQAVNLDTFPATFFIGRDGLVKSIHAGFAGTAMGPLHEELVAEINTTLAKLLAAK